MWIYNNYLVGGKIIPKNIANELYNNRVYLDFNFFPHAMTGWT